MIEKSIFKLFFENLIGIYVCVSLVIILTQGGLVVPSFEQLSPVSGETGLPVIH